MINSSVILSFALAGLAISLVLTAPAGHPDAPDLSQAAAGGPIDLSTFSYRHPAPNAARGPCPFLNTAANHALLPRSGKKISFERLAEALAAMGLPGAFKNLLVGGLRKGIVNETGKTLAANHPADSFDLTDLNMRGVFEHDLSFARRDQDPADGQRVDPALVESLIDMAKHNGRGGVLGYSDLSRFRRLRYEQETARGDHTVRYNAKDQLLGAGECALLLQILGRDGRISPEYARSILLNERFPADWTPVRENGFLLMSKILAGTAKCSIGYFTPDSILKHFSGSDDEDSEQDIDGVFSGPLSQSDIETAFGHGGAIETFDMNSIDE